MKFSLRILSGDKEGQAIPFEAGQVISFGRTNAANVSFEDDGHMSGLHFEIEHRGGSVEIRDLNSTNGTWINGDRINTAQLDDGQRIKAGHTQFMAAIERPAHPRTRAPSPISDSERVLDRPIPQGALAPTMELPSGAHNHEGADPWDTNASPVTDVELPHVKPREDLPKTMPIDSTDGNPVESPKVSSPIESVNIPADQPPVPRQVRPPLAEPRRKSNLVDNPFGSDSFPVGEVLDLGTNAPRSDVEAQGPSPGDVVFLQKAFNPEGVEDTLRTIVSVLQQSMSIVAVAHFQKIRMTTPHELTSAQPLLNWLPKAVSRDYGPVLLDYAAWESIAERQLLGRLCLADALIVFLGSNQQVLTSQLKEMTRMEIAGFSEGDGFLGCCWPSTFTALHDCSERSAYSKLFGKAVTGAILCPPQRPTELAAYAKPSLLGSLKHFGFVARS